MTRATESLQMTPGKAGAKVESLHICFLNAAITESAANAAANATAKKYSMGASSMKSTDLRSHTE